MSMMFRIIMIVTVVSFLTRCGASNDESGEEKSPATPAVNENTVYLTPTQMKNADIVVGEPVKRRMSTTINVNGMVDVPPTGKVYVSNPFGGFVKKMSLLPGTHVKKGEALTVMEDPQYIQLQQDYLVAKTRLQFLDADYKRQSSLNADKSISDKVFQQTTSDFTSQKIQVRSLEEKLRLININPVQLSESTITRSVTMYSPVTGYVSAVHAAIGKYSSPTDVLFELIDEEELHASLTVFEKDIHLISAGQKVNITTPARPGQRYAATVHAVNRSLQEDRSAEVHCHFDNADKNLLPGMFITAQLAVSAAEAYSVPEDAVVTSDGKAYVFIEKGSGLFEMTTVETGMNTDGFVQTVTDLSGKKLVVKNAYSLLMKIKNTEE